MDILFLPGKTTNICHSPCSKFNNLAYHVNAPFPKIWLLYHKKNGLGKSIKSEEKKTSLEEIIPALHISGSVILKYLEFSEIGNVSKENVYPKTWNANLFWINLWKILNLLKKSINPFKTNFPCLGPPENIKRFRVYRMQWKWLQKKNNHTAL